MILIQVKQGPRAFELCASVPWDEAVSVQFQAMPGVRYDKARRCFAGDAEAISAVCKTLVAAQMAIVEKEESNATGTPSVIPFDPVVAPAGLFPYQIDGVSRVAEILDLSHSALLCDEMGLGKSAQAIAVADWIAPDGDILIVCPAVVVRHWEGQLKRWARDPSRFRITSSAKLASIAKGGTKTVEPLRADPALIVFDEIHHFSNWKSQRSKAAKAIVSSCAHRPFLLGLTGTLMTARVRDLWHPLDLLWPRRFGHKWNFEKRYCNGHYEDVQGVENPIWIADGSSRLPELKARLGACMVRRIKSEVAHELPSLSREIVEVEIPKRAAKDLNRAILAIGTDKIGASSLLSNVEAYKIETAVELAEEIKATGGSPLVLATRISSALEIGRRLNAPVVTGDVPAEQRQEALHGMPVGVATIYSVTTGIDLTSFDAVIFVGLDWIPSTLLQAEARAHRIGQNRNVAVYYLVGIGTIDEIVRERVLSRLEIFAATVGAGSDGMSAALAGASEEEILADLVSLVMEGKKKNGK